MPDAGVRGILRIDETGGFGVEIGVENTSLREPWAGVRLGVGAALCVASTVGVSADDTRSASPPSRLLLEESNTVSTCFVIARSSALPRDVYFRLVEIRCSMTP
jgi:hypothetical protein